MDKQLNTGQQLEITRDSQPIFVPLLIILVVTVISQLANIAYNNSNSGQDFQSVLLPSVLFLCLTTIPFAWLGLWLGPQIGLGAPRLAALLRKQPGATKQWLKDTRLAALLGLSMGAGMVLLRVVTEPYLPPEITQFGYRGFLGGVLVSAGAAVSEEVWFRLGLMTLLVWTFARLLEHKSIRPALAWPVIIIVSFAFGLAHLPQLMSYGAGSPLAIWATVIGNSLVGTMYGWCYWRRGFIAAVIAHFSVDVVIHAIPALFV